MRIGTVNYLLIYGITASVFFVIDMLWLGWVARGLFRNFTVGRVGEGGRAQRRGDREDL